MTYSIYVHGRLHIRTQCEDLVEEELFELKDSGISGSTVEVVSE